MILKHIFIISDFIKEYFFGYNLFETILIRHKNRFHSNWATIRIFRWSATAKPLKAEREYGEYGEYGMLPTKT